MIDFVRLMDPKTIQISKSDMYFDDSSWTLEQKINGRRIQSLIVDDVSFAGRYARDGKENINDFKYKFFKIYNDLKKMGLPNGTLLDGEVYLPGRPVSQTFQIINSDIDDAVRLQEQYGFLKYVIFDIIYLGNKSLVEKTLLYRRQQLEKIVQSTFNIELIKVIINNNDKRLFWKKILESRSEEKGVLFKFDESDYQFLKSKFWRKLKSFETYDAVIVGFKLDEKYPDDFVSSIRVAQYRKRTLVPVANVSGLTREQADDFRSNMNLYMGKVIQFRSDSKTTNSYKNPQFDYLRPDKLPESCVWED